ncbi:hypothetical protein RHAL1_03589 [Beijerinckiaceae bacterium RH AL1]|nr:PHB depolymerase family esterase [Beijerinckiaceae bacterium]VVB48966.1 hypothetical protein RHCH11_RHCH11_03521 [Beijerinckiaceae bacterium RH CH11]VVB49045.1 hypothetical protein RHAL8_03517 [Beijerinckiaceae bacterium RH AL8]VVC56660.1 hypothetical protein RHAL1_03589 [Beijerinckiaceae bacterium RH AL1]
MDTCRDELRYGDGDGAAGGARVGALRDVESFGSNPGNLRLRLVPPDGPGKPLVVALHGCTQTAAGFAEGSGWRRLAEANGFALLLPEQRATNNRKTCFSWFEPHDIRRGEGEVESIRQMIAHTIAACRSDARRVYVTGLSAGGSMACALLATYPELFAGGAIVAGLPYGAASSAAEAFDCMFVGRTREPRIWGDAVRVAAPAPVRWPTVAIWQGTADTVVKPINAGELAKQWTNVHGVSSQVPLEDEIGATTRRMWRDGAKRPCVIEYSVPALGHGMPVDEDAPPAPFFLPAGIDAAEQIAADFGITRARRSRTLLARLGFGS